MTARIYLDANATTALAPTVADAMAAAERDAWANPSSLHTAGRTAARRLAEARETTSDALGCRPHEVVFTSGGTESDRLAILGALAAAGGGGHVVSSSIEHPAVRSLLLRLASRGEIDVTWVDPQSSGAVAPSAIERALRTDTRLVALMWANNETGVLQPVHEVAESCAERGIACLVDAVQVAGKLDVASSPPRDAFLAVSAHKLHGPKGVGALVVPESSPWSPPWPAGQESGRRAGTVPVPLCVGLAAALTLAVERLGRWTAVEALRDRLERSLVGALDDVSPVGSAPRTPNTVNLHFAGHSAERLMSRLDRVGIDVSDGSACTSGSVEPSHVLLAHGLDDEAARQCLRFSLGRDTDAAGIDQAIAAVIEAVETLRRASRRQRRRS